MVKIRGTYMYGITNLIFLLLTYIRALFVLGLLLHLQGHTGIRLLLISYGRDSCFHFWLLL